MANDKNPETFATERKRECAQGQRTRPQRSPRVGKRRDKKRRGTSEQPGKRGEVSTEWVVKPKATVQEKKGKGIHDKVGVARKKSEGRGKKEARGSCLVRETEGEEQNGPDLLRGGSDGSRFGKRPAASSVENFVRRGGGDYE